jgi:GNAT superfamily N-acetyltransferase
VVIQSFVRDDLKFIRDLQPEGWGDITPSIDFYTKSSFCFPRKVMVDDEIAGIGTAIIHDAVAWLAHIIVRPEFRKRGIGRFITEALLSSVEVKKCETVYLIATELGAPVYHKVGFETETEYLYFKDVKIDNLLMTSQMIYPYEAGFRKQVAETDKASSTENRLFHLEPHFKNGYVYSSGKIEGFYLPTFGDGLIIADNPSAGIELLKLHLHSNNKIAFPKDNLAATNYLDEKGFKEFSTGKRMRIGKKRNVKLENIYNRIGGNLG